MSKAPPRSVIHVGERPEPLRAPALFLDGVEAQAREASLRLVEEGAGAVLEISARGAHPRRWPLAELRRLADDAREDELILLVPAEPLARLIVTEPEAVRVIAARAPALDRRLPVQGRGRIAAWALGAVAAVALMLWVLIPATADRLAAWLPPEGERALGETVLSQIRWALGDDRGPVRICESAEGRAALDALGARLAGGIALPHPLRLHVFDHELVNAFALPGGQVVVFRGLLDLAGDSDELAAVLAHELGHVARRDPTRIALRSAGSVGILGLIFGDFAGGGIALVLAQQLMEAGYSREVEAAADAFAHDALVRAGIAPSALARIFRRMQELTGAKSVPLLRHFASHPDFGERIAAATAADGRLAAAARPALDPTAWAALKGICGR